MSKVDVLTEVLDKYRGRLVNGKRVAGVTIVNGKIALVLAPVKGKGGRK